jgi:crossover junction endodeoxyribonuclease RuvC
LQKIHKDIIKLIERYKPNLLAIETLFFFKNLKTVMPVSQTRGVILLAAAEKKIPILEFTPLQMKMTIVGYGRAEKKQVQEMIRNCVDLSKFDLKKNHRKKDDSFDAIGVAICAAFKNY